MSSYDENILNQNIDKLIGEKFGNYSKYIIQERALPDLRDGLKPVQRRILFAMHSLRLNHNTPYKKSARVVGDVIGKYHPHGDTSVYEAMVRLAQEWKMNIPLVDMHGNKGSVDGDSPAAMRYTEARLAKISSELLKNIEKKLVSFSPNFDDSEIEPVVLPARFPNLLINGSTGIASGYSTNIPPHNIKEIINALIFILKNESVTLNDLMKFIKGPDFPTGAQISSKESITEAYKHGKGKIAITSKWIYNKKTSTIEITEIPFEVNKAELVSKIDELVRDNKIPNVKLVRDDTDKDGLLISLICKPEIDPDLVMNYLFKKTDLRKNYSFNMVAIESKKPRLMSLLDILEYFSIFQINIYTKLYKYELSKAKDRLEVVDGLIKVVSIIEEVIRVIRSSKNKADAKNNIISKFKFTEIQAEAIVTLRLYRLTSTDITQLKEEKDNLNDLIKHYKKALDDEKYLKDQIIKELEYISDEYGVERRSEIIGEIDEVKIEEKDLIQEEDVWISVTHQGYIKQMSERSKSSSENLDTQFGKRENDLIITLVKESNLKNIILFTSSGRYFSIPIYKIPEFKWKDVGEHISKYCSMGSKDRIIAVDVLRDFNKLGDLVISTNNGLIKRSKISTMNLSQTKNGNKFISLKENDSVVSVAISTNDDDQILTITKHGFAIRYLVDSISYTGLNSSGMKNINLSIGDNVASTLISPKNRVEEGKSQFIIVTHNGKAKRLRFNDIKLSSRGSKGSLVTRQVKTNPYFVINAFNVDLIDDVIVLNSKDEIIIEKPKIIISLSDTSTGLSKLSSENIVLAFGTNGLSIDSLKEKRNTKEVVLTVKEPTIEKEVSIEKKIIVKKKEKTKEVKLKKVKEPTVEKEIFVEEKIDPIIPQLEELTLEDNIKIKDPGFGEEISIEKAISIEREFIEKTKEQFLKIEKPNDEKQKTKKSKRIDLDSILDDF